MKKKLTIIIFLLILAVASYLYWNNKFVQFQPLEFNSHEYIISNEEVSIEFYNELKKVLKYYKEDFKNENDIVYVRNKLFRNRELMFNYTKKANDSTWLSER